MTLLEGFKFVKTIVLVFKKIESEGKKSITLYLHSNQEQLSMNVTSMVYSNQSILQLYQTYNILPKELDHPKKELINIQNMNALMRFSQIFKFYRS